MKTEIFCFVYNRTDLLPRQLECFRKYFKGEYNLNVVCDYRDTKYLKEFRKICKKEKITLHEHKSNTGLSPSMYLSLIHN